MLNTLLAALLALGGLTGVPPAGAPAVATAGGQFRAYWVDAFGEGMRTAAEVDEVVAATKAANLNAIVAQVVRRGDCFCGRASAPRTEAAGVTPAPFDPLDTLIAKAHAQGIEVHAWIIATGMWNSATGPAAPEHIFNRHGPSTAGRDNWVTLRSDGLDRVGTEYHLDPGHPDAAAWVVSVATSIVRSYAVDGLNLDRIRYPDGNLASGVPSWGYNATALARFQAATGRADRPAPQDAQWAQWRRDQVTAIVRRVYLESFAIRPSVRVSIDGIAYGGGPAAQGGWERTRTYAEQLQDWRGWLREGIVDLAIPMNYKRDATPAQKQMYDEWSEWSKDNSFGRHVAIGSALYLNEIGASVRQVRGAVSASAAGNTAAGWVGYSYRTPDLQTDAGTRTGTASRGILAFALTQPSTYDAITPPVFASAAAVPAMTWKTQPTTGHVHGTLRDGAGAALADQQVVLTSEATGASRSATTDGTGWFGFADVAPGRYRVTSGPRSATVSVLAGRIATATPQVAAPTCVSSTGPGIPPPATVPVGIPGLHAAWYGQSGYPTLCAGDRATAVVAFYNSGSVGWVAGRMGEMAFLGTWEPEPGQDRASILGGDGSAGSPATGWPRYNRVAAQPSDYVGPGQVAWFQFTVQAPTTPGTYRLAIRPLVEGARWLEDYGVFWYVTVK
ncbi:MAG TPA: family 10 glycosylhydrolase [Candidatus Limnocylindria bacterium]|nr:family 10 glycosylhydrolase [Candidatus Limnocylindria bacterium]